MKQCDEKSDEKSYDHEVQWVSKTAAKIASYVAKTRDMV